MSTDWFTAMVGLGVGVAGAVFGWLTSKQAREHAERLGAQANEHARVLSQQNDEQARRMLEMRFEHADRTRRSDQSAEAYVEIMTVVRTVTGDLGTDSWSAKDVKAAGATATVAHGAELARAAALTDTFASAAVLELFSHWRETIRRAHGAIDRLVAASSATDDPTSDNVVIWRRELRDLRLKATDARQALADAIADELGARRRPEPAIRAE